MITVQNIVNARSVPPAARVKRYVNEALGGKPCEVTVRFVGSAESRRLNRRYRGKDRPTNVLSFAYGPHPTDGSAIGPPLSQRERGVGRRSAAQPILGDVVLCVPVVRREAREQGKTLPAHWAHMIVHGALHLQGYDHVRQGDARRMEARERAILARFRFADPYLISN